MKVAYPDKEYSEFLSRGQFMLPANARTGKALFYPRVIEPGTGDDLEWIKADGRGVVYSTTVIRPKNGAPYNVALIDLVEGVRMMSRVEGLEPENVKIGMTVTARIIESDGRALVVFAPAGGV